MKHVFLPVSLAGAALAAALAFRAPHAEPKKTPPHPIVFEVTTDDAQAWEMILNNVDNVRRALGPSTIEVVVHGRGLSMVTAAKAGAVRDRMKADAEQGVTFAACENTMRKLKVTKDDLLPFATTVDSGIAEVVRRQEAGFSYVRSGM